jgi:hypothetical protein
MRSSEGRGKQLAKRFVRFLGSIQLAVPVMIFVAIAMAWGTYLESTQNSAVSRANVYGSWWFMALMGLICVSLVFAVVNRYPWKRKHIGFITVHAGLVILIVGSFWSMVGRIEGHLTLEEGTKGDQIETEREVVELAEFNMGQSTIIGTAAAPSGAGSLRLGPMALEVLERWDNCREVQYVANDAREPLRAIELSGNPTATEGDWVAEEAKAGGAPTLEGMTIRVLADGADWTPPAAPVKSPTGFVFMVGEQEFPLGEVGAEAMPGWRVVSVQRFERATVSGGKISEGGAEVNPAIEVVISDGKGTSERHSSFKNFPDMVLFKAMEGQAKSGGRLTVASASRRAETLVVFGPVAAAKFGYVGPDGAGRVLDGAGLPRVLELGSHRVRVLKQFDRARAAVRFERAPSAGDRRPALVVRVAGRPDPVVLAWKAFESVPTSANQLLRFGPQMVRLPFAVTLKDFRKTDYPGTEMAMAYESEVVISREGQADEPHLIHMNSPFAAAPWKVYQSGFIGEKVSVFSVMRDPGLPLTYLGSVVLCVGIVLTFFVRPTSSGHPGIPAPSFIPERKGHHAPEHEAVDLPVDLPVRVRAAEPVGAGV